MEVLAARLEDEVVGVLVLARRLSVSIGGWFMSVEELYVLPRVRNRGVGRALLEAAKNRCLDLSISYVEVEVVEDSAEGFYRAFGFEVEDDVRVMSHSYPMRG